MMPIVTVKSFLKTAFDEKEILRYARCAEANEETMALLRSCLQEAEPILTAKLCYVKLPIRIDGDRCEMDDFSIVSKDLAKNLQGCEYVLLLCATVGIELDRLIAKYGRFSPSRALLLQAIGTERIEALCDDFCQEYAQENACTLKPRFSCGYGDLPLETQRQIFALLNCSKHIGVYLNDSLLMVPSKSVTAFVGIL